MRITSKSARSHHMWWTKTWNFFYNEFIKPLFDIVCSLEGFFIFLFTLIIAYFYHVFKIGINISLEFVFFLFILYWFLFHLIYRIYILFVRILLNTFLNFFEYFYFLTSICGRHILFLKNSSSSSGLMKLLNFVPSLAPFILLQCSSPHCLRFLDPINVSYKPETLGSVSPV